MSEYYQSVVNFHVNFDRQVHEGQTQMCQAELSNISGIITDIDEGILIHDQQSTSEYSG